MRFGICGLIVIGLLSNLAVAQQPQERFGTILMIEDAFDLMLKLRETRIVSDQFVELTHRVHLSGRGQRQFSVAFARPEKTLRIAFVEDLIGGARIQAFTQNADKGRRALTAIDKKVLKTIFDQLRQKERRSDDVDTTLQLLSFLISFVPQDEAIPDFNLSDRPDLQARERQMIELRAKGFQTLCHAIKNEHVGSFTGYNTKLVNEKAVIGETQSECYGRCGPGCHQFYEIRRKQYTQECFNHDLCNRILASNFGPCKDEFWTAAWGYMMAPNCLF